MESTQVFQAFKLLAKMWSTVTITNETNCIVNIALKLATPLYYENKVMPGQSLVR